MKIPSATADSPADDAQQQQLPPLPVLDSFVTIEKTEEFGGHVSSRTADVTSCEAAGLTAGTDQEKAKEGAFARRGSSASDLSEGDEEFTDLLIDTLDVEFDPRLLL